MKSRFYAKTQPEPNSGCLLWTASVLQTSGYGRFSVSGKPQLAHRVAWELERGPILDGMCVLHRCDVRTCVNVEHLFLGTYRDNVRDMMAKGRDVRLRGENHPIARLNALEVSAIRDEFAKGNTQLEIAKRRGLSRDHVHKIVRNKIWNSETPNV